MDDVSHGEILTSYVDEMGPGVFEVTEPMYPEPGTGRMVCRYRIRSQGK